MDTIPAIKKIVVLGPESTGKSTLCEKLAAHFKTHWVKEYAREYLHKEGNKYAFEDLFIISLGQLAGEDEATKLMQKAQCDSKLLFIDTDLHVIMIWSEFVFNKTDNRILDGIAKREYDLYLLCDTDLPWIKDELREYPDLKTRKQLFHYFKVSMADQGKPWVIISGNYDKRLQSAISAVNHFVSPIV